MIVAVLDGVVVDWVGVTDTELELLLWVGAVMAEQVALPPGGGAESMQRAPSGGSLRLSSQFPGCREPSVHRRMILLPPLPSTQ